MAGVQVSALQIVIPAMAIGITLMGGAMTRSSEDCLSSETQVKAVVTFPVIAFLSQSAPCLIESERSFLVWPVSTYKSGLSGMRVVDVTGTEFRVGTVQRVGYPGPFFGFSLTCERSLRVKFSIQETGRHFTCDDLRERILKELFIAFSDALDGEYDNAEVDKQLSKAHTIRELFESYSKYLGMESA